MRLTPAQYLNITAVLSKYGIAEVRVSLVKKKGRITIRIEGIESYFEFFRRKKIELDKVTLQWKKSECYEISYMKQRQTVEDWGAVLNHCEHWIKACA